MKERTLTIMKKRMMAVVITLIMTSTFVGCSSTAAPVKETKETEAMVVKEETVEVAEVKEVEAEPTPEPTPEPIPEATEEPTPEPIVYEGIDMESTLPGKEWVATFKGVIEEPKFVVFNDTTNKKIIVEDGQDVKFEEDDMFGIYIPSGISVTNDSGIRLVKATTYNTYYKEFIFDMEHFQSKKTFRVELDVNGETVKMSCNVEPAS